MTLPPQPLRLFHPQFADHIDVATQVDRMPGTADAPCLCDPPRDPCLWSFCPWQNYLPKEEQ